MKKSSLNLYPGMILNAVYANLPAAREHLMAAKIGAMLVPLVTAGPAMAQGFIRGLQNMNILAQAIVALIITIGLLAGLSYVLGGLVSAYKKYDRGNEDVTWGKIAIQIGAGGLAMALGWVGIQVVETLGGSSSEIGKSIR